MHNINKEFNNLMPNGGKESFNHPSNDRRKETNWLISGEASFGSPTFKSNLKLPMFILVRKHQPLQWNNKKGKAVNK
jgi:hypothetical protein